MAVEVAVAALDLENEYLGLIVAAGSAVAAAHLLVLASAMCHPIVVAVLDLHR
jgi:hypothetical protein